MNRRKPHARSGYMLVMCLLVVAVSSSIVLTMFQMVRLQTLESQARRQVVQITSLSDAAREHAVAILIDQPEFRGTLGPFKVPAAIAQSYSFSITETKIGLQIDSQLQVGTSVQAATETISLDALKRRLRVLNL